MSEGMLKVVGFFGGVFILCYLTYGLWRMAHEAFGVFLYLVPLAIAGLAFYFWQRSTQRSDHPWH